MAEPSIDPAIVEALKDALAPHKREWYVLDIADIIAAAVDAARAEGDKQGAARVREAVKAGACDCGGDAVRHTVGADRRCPVHGYGTHVEWRFIRAALTEAAPHD